MKRGFSFNKNKGTKILEFHSPGKAHDVVIIGGGLHGLACAYYLAAYHGFKDIVVLERNRIGYGGSGRNTEVFRANQRAPEILPLYAESVKLWETLSEELDFNIMVWQRGLIGTAHTEAGLNAIRVRHETQKLLGIESYLLGPEEIKKMIPSINLGQNSPFPIIGGYYHPPAGTARHDAALWGFAKACVRNGVRICQGVEVSGIQVRHGKITGVTTNEGTISTPVILIAAGGYSSEVARLAGVKLPVVTFPLQALVTEPVKPFLNHVIISEHYFCYAQQSLKGDLIMGAHLDPWQTYKLYNTFQFVQELASGMLELFPQLAHIKVMRCWSGLCDLTVDSSPVMGTCEVEGLFLDVGWGYFGFKSSPICGKLMAQYIATGKRPELIRDLGIDRFYRAEMVPETLLVRG